MQTVLLHACCAPCSSAIVEWLLAHHITPVIYYYNPNIFPEEEYLIRKEESKRHADSLGVRWIDGDYDHTAWRQTVCGLEHEPERGNRCAACFRHRLLAAARMAQQEGIPWFATTLASSRWKSLDQINAAGLWAEEQLRSPLTNNLSPLFWAQNWRKGGLQQRRNELLRQFGFYNQQYCGCEFSMRTESN
ncbi:MAG: epoxyqueuosine reductase QueH [Paludibacteraceae bacterium]|nr:epoxyqueuosine reductase QueH [Paludibacteraceae bacterium]